MDSKALISFVVVAAFILCVPTADAFNITRLLDRYPSFSTFNNYLTQTNLVGPINRRQTLTVLVVDNSAIGSLSGKPLDVVKRILSTHVILDYYDTLKLSDLSRKSTLMTNLYQTTGIASNQQGFINITKKANGDFLFGSAVKGSVLDSLLLQQVYTHPYNISVLQVSSVINTPGFDAADLNATSPPAAAPTPKKSPPPAEAPEAEAPAVEAPADEPTAAESTDAPADAPVADGPSDAPAADKPKKSSGIRVASSGSLLVVLGLVSLFW